MNASGFLQNESNGYEFPSGHIYWVRYAFYVWMPTVFCLKYAYFAKSSYTEWLEFWYWKQLLIEQFIFVLVEKIDIIDDNIQAKNIWHCIEPNIWHCIENTCWRLKWTQFLYAFLRCHFVNKPSPKIHVQKSIVWCNFKRIDRDYDTDIDTREAENHVHSSVDLISADWRDNVNW